MVGWVGAGHGHSRLCADVVADRRCPDPVQQVEVDEGHRPGVTTAEAQRINELEREVRELRRANEILRKASAFLAAAELDRKLK